MAVLVLFAGCGDTGAASPPMTVAPPATTGGPPPGTLAPQPTEPGSSGPAEPTPQGDLTVPQPGQLDVHPIQATSIEAAVDGRNVTLKISWTSGIEPCYVLDTIVVSRTGMEFGITLNEGHAPGDNVCIEIAKFKFALVELGELAPGTYMIRDATGGAEPIQVEVP